LLRCYRHPARTLKQYMTWPTVPWLLEWRTRLTMVSLWRYRYAHVNFITDIWINLANDVYTLAYEVEVNLRPTVSRPVCLGVRRPSRTFDRFFFLLEISFTHLRVCYFVASSLTRGWVCNLL
jgi:hypothetical protein